MADTNGLVAQPAEATVLPEANGPSPAARPMTQVEKDMCRGQVWPEACGLPEHGTVVNGALFFRVLPTREAVVAEFTQQLSQHLRFRSLAMEDGTWRPATIDPDYHFVEEPASTDSAGVHQTIERLISENLDHSHPLWRVHLVPCTAADGGMPAVVLRVHHCIGDGFAIATIFQQMARGPDGKPAEDTALMRRLAQQQAEHQRACSMHKACRSVGMGLDAVKSFCANASVPYRPLETQTKFTKSRAERKGTVRYGGPRKVVFVPPHSLKYVKACKDAAHKTVNDVVLSATSGAIRRYCQQQDDPTYALRRRIRTRAMIPVANPDQGSSNPEDRIANNFAFVSVPLAVQETEPLARLKSTGATMRKIKHSTKAIVSLWQMNRLSTVLSQRMNQNIANDLFANHSLIFSNVPGPDVPIYIAGQHLESVQAIFPNFLSQIILISYNGRIHMNWAIDPELLQNADSLAECYIAELRAIGSSLGVSGDPLDCD